MLQCVSYMGGNMNIDLGHTQIELISFARFCDVFSFVDWPQACAYGTMHGW